MNVYQWYYWTSNPSNLREVPACPWGPKTVLFRLAKVLLEALTIYTTCATSGKGTAYTSGAPN